MGNLRKRKIPNVGGGPPRSKSHGATVHPVVQVAKMFFMILVIILTIVVFCVTFCNMSPYHLYKHGTNTLDSISLMMGLQQHVYAVVIDAGSTGSRVLAFTFHKSIADGSLKLDDELWMEVKPGLGAFADDPVEGAATIQQLLDKAKERIPKMEWRKTPLVLKATAGLRMLPEAKAEGLLREIRTLFKNSGFFVTDNSVGILDGTDEGLFSWFTINFLLDRVALQPEHTVVALDLGGGSTQITFAVSTEESVHNSPDGFIHPVSMYHKTLNVYTHSYLGLGLMAARLAVLGYNHPRDASVFNSHCINPLINTEWTFSGKTYQVKGPPADEAKYLLIKGKAGRIPEERPVVDFDKCVAIIKNVVQDRVHKPSELNSRDISAFSYYFDRATEAGLIDPFTGGSVTVEHYYQTAQKTCAVPNADQPFACLDLTYIAVLLNKGYGLQPKARVDLHKKIDGHETSWALGAAFHVLNNGI